VHRSFELATKILVLTNEQFVILHFTAVSYICMMACEAQKFIQIQSKFKELLII
jgi:hypothetical protein